jgi:hypothetical protein
MALSELLQETRRQPSPNAHRTDPKSDREPTNDGPGSIARRCGSAIKHPERLTRTVEEDPAGRRERNPAAVALKQLDPNRRLQLADLGAENLLCDMEPAGCGGKTGFLGDTHEVAEMAHLDVHHGRY